MKKILFLFGLLLVQWYAVAQVPVITTFAPASGAIGSSVILSGSGFNTTTSQNIVFFGATQATVTAASATNLTVSVPIGANFKYITVTNLAVNLTAYSAKPFIVTLAGKIAFATKQDYYTNTNPAALRAVTMVDIDGDGKPDMVAASEGGSPITVLRNTSTSGITSFDFRLGFGNGNSFYSLTIGDVDGDGKPDVIGISGFSIVSVFRNTSTPGNISFADYLSFGTGGQAKSVSIGDIDRDGKPDLAVSNGLGNSISVLRNTSTIGVISFATKVDFVITNNNYSVSMGDMDGDGKVDLMASNGNSNTISVLRNTSTIGTVSFATKVDFATGTNSSSLCIGDIDGNGKLDIAITNQTSNTLSVLRNTSTVSVLSFAAKVDFATGTAPIAIAIGDIDGDGKPDLGVANSTANTVSVLRNTSISGTISFVAKVDFATGSNPLYVTIGDNDGDGKPDLAVANYSYDSVSIFQQLPIVTLASFSPASGPIGTSVTIIGTGFNATAGQNSVYFGAVKASVTAASATSLTVTVPIGATYENISVTNLGVALTGYSVKPFTVTLAGNIAFGNKQDFATGTTPTSVSIGDIDSDGKSDMVVTSYNNNKVSVYRNISTSGNTNFDAKVDFATNSSPNMVKLIDIDGDGKLDLIVLNGQFNIMSVFRNTSVSGTITFAAKVDLPSGLNSLDVSIGDLNNDGKPDLVTANANSNTVSVYRNISTLGSVIFAAKVDLTPFSGTISVAIDDIDGDGKSDLIIANNGPTVSVLRNTTTTATTISFAAKVDFSIDIYASVLKIGDIDGDGKLDIATSNWDTNVISILRNTSTIGVLSFAAKVNFAAGANTIFLSIGDIDGDGKPDISASNYGGISVSVFRSLSSPGVINFATKVDFTTGTGPKSNSISDIDGDGKPDLVVVNGNASTVSILRQLDLPQGSLSTSGPICTSGTGQLTFTATAGSGPFTVIYNDGTENRTVTDVVSGIPFNVFTNPVTSSTTYTLVSVSYPNYAIRTTGFIGPSAAIAVQADCNSIINLKLYIEGYYDIGTNNMKSVRLNQGASTSTTDVETITLELHHAVNFGLLEATTATLQTDGSAIGAFTNTPNGSYYIAVKGRNVIKTWSALPQSIGSSPLMYDFTGSASKAYGDNMAEVETGVWAFYSGDVNQDGNIDTIDYPILEFDFNNFLSGDYLTDLNGDGNVDTIDYPLFEYNSNNFVSELKP